MCSHGTPHQVQRYDIPCTIASFSEGLFVRFIIHGAKIALRCPITWDRRYEMFSDCARVVLRGIQVFSIQLN